MKKNALIKMLRMNGYELMREGKHSIYSNGVQIVAVPRHNDLNKMMVKGILKQLTGNFYAN